LPAWMLAAYTMGFFLFTWLGLYYFTGYLFFFQEKSALFQTTGDYFFSQISRPGGLLYYLAQLQTAFYYYPLAGALIIAAELLLLGLLIGRAGDLVGQKTKNLFIAFLFISVFYYLQLNYQHMAVNTLGMLMQIAAYYLTIRLLKNRATWIIPVLPLLIYFVSGFFSSVFLVMVTLHLLLSGERQRLLKTGLLLLLTTAGFLTGRAFLFYRTDHELLLYPFSLQHTGMQGHLFIPLMVLFALMPVMHHLRVPAFRWKLTGKVLPHTPLLMLLLLAALSFKKMDVHNARYFQVENLFYRQKYNEVVAFNLKYPSRNMLTGFFNNIALCETGQLNDLLFSFPQSPDGGTLFLKWEMVSEVLKRGAYWYYSLGLINEAQRWAYENMVMKGYTPEGIKMLIKTELINGNHQVAAKYVSILKNTLFYRRQACDFEKLLFNQQAVAAHRELGMKRKQKPGSDFFVLTDNPKANLELLIKSDSTNRAAVDYHFAWLLIQKNIPEVVKNLPLLERAGYSRMPLHIDEAATGFKLVKMGEFPRMQKLDISAPVAQRFDHFYRLLQQYNSSKQQAQQALSKEYGQSFWFYYFFS